MPADATCTVTESVTGATGTVTVATTGSPQTVTIVRAARSSEPH